MILRLILLESTQVTKSSMFRVTMNAGSVTTSVPTRTWPCSMNVVAYQSSQFYDSHQCPHADQTITKHRHPPIRDAEKTYSFNSLNQPRPNHQNRQPPPTKRRNSNLPLNTRQPRTLLARLFQNPHPPQLLQQLRLKLLAHGIRVRVQLGELVRKLADRSA